MTQIDTSTERFARLKDMGVTDYLHDALVAERDALRAEVDLLKAEAVATDLDAVTRAMWHVNCPDSTYDEAVKAAQQGSAIDASIVRFMQELAKAALSAITARTEDEVWNEAVDAAVNVAESEEDDISHDQSPFTRGFINGCHGAAEAIRALTRPTKG